MQSKDGADATGTLAGSVGKTVKIYLGGNEDVGFRTERN
jgi:hypothetical protein